MFKGRIISRSNVNGKVHTFQKDFDDYDTYQKFVSENPEYNTVDIFRNFWNPWGELDRFFGIGNGTHRETLPAPTKHLPEGVSLDKYERRRLEKRQSEAEKAEKRYTLEKSKTYLEDYLSENPEDQEAQDDLKKIESELQSLAN